MFIDPVWTGTEILRWRNVLYFAFFFTLLFVPHRLNVHIEQVITFKTNLASLHISRLESHKNVFLLPEPSASSSPFFIWACPFHVELAQ
jgi:hypothetical protein